MTTKRTDKEIDRIVWLVIIVALVIAFILGDQSQISPAVQ